MFYWKCIIRAMYYTQISDHSFKPIIALYPMGPEWADKASSIDKISGSIRTRVEI